MKLRSGMKNSSELSTEDESKMATNEDEYIKGYFCFLYSVQFSKSRISKKNLFEYYNNLL